MSTTLIPQKIDNSVDSILFRCLEDPSFAEQLKYDAENALSEYQLTTEEKDIFLEKGEALLAKLFGGNDGIIRNTIVVVVVVVIDDFQHPHNNTEGLLNSFAESLTDDRSTFREYIDNLESEERLSVLKEMMSLIQR